MPARVSANEVVGMCWRGLTACAVERVLGLRDREVALSDAVLAIVELADNTAGSFDRGAIGGEGEFAVTCQRSVKARGSRDDSPQGLGWNAGLGHGGQGDEAESRLHFALDGC